jgi:hypothetical protein
MVRLFLMMTFLPFVLNAQVYSNQNIAMGIDAIVNNSLFGSGVSFHDFNGDGWDDLSIALENQVKFYANINGVCTPQSFPFGLLEKCKHPIWVDYDNDGDKDFYLTQYNAPNKLFRNNGNNQFTDVSLSSGLTDFDTPHFGASWGDYDRDGDLDVYVCNYIYLYFGTDVYNYWDHLYRNNGNGTFTDVTLESGASDGVSLSFQSVWMDYNNDLWPDLYVINDKEHPNRLYHNNGDGTFTDVGTSTSSALTMVDAMTASCGDMNNDGYMDIFVSNTSIGPCALLKNSSSGNFLNIAGPSGTSLSILGWGANWFDYDLDMDQDLYICEYFPQYSELQNKFMKNQGNETFTNVNPTVFPFDFSNSYTSGTGDWNHDGYPDLVVSNYSPQNTNFWLSSGGNKHSISIALEGVVSNRDGIGAWIHVYAGGEHQVRYTMCGENYMGQDSQYELFGLNDYTTVDSVQIDWPSGHVDHYYDVPADQRLMLVEGDGFVANIAILDNEILCQGDSIILDAGDFQSFLWDDLSIERYRTIYETGTYSVEVTSDLGFTTSASITINPAFNPELEFSVVYPSCFGYNDGAIQYTAEVLPDNIQWSLESQENSITQLSAGVYTLQVSYENGCAFNYEWNLIEPDSLIVHFDISDVLCKGDSSGSVIVSETNADGYLINWENPELNENSLPVGEYAYVLTDENGCTIESFIEIYEPDTLGFEIDVIPVDCFGANTGQAVIDITGGNAPYSIDWGNNNPNSLSAGAYVILAQDSTACLITVPFEITEPTELLASTQISCSNQLMDVELIVEGGSPPYQYLWSDGSELPGITGIMEGSILGVLVSDSNGCEFPVENISCPVGIEVTNKTPLFLYPNPFTDIVHLNCVPNQVLSISIMDMQGRLISKFLTNSSNDTFNLTRLTSGVYFIKFYNDQGIQIGYQKLFKI